MARTQINLACVCFDAYMISRGSDTLGHASPGFFQNIFKQVKTSYLLGIYDASHWDRAVARHVERNRGSKVIRCSFSTKRSWTRQSSGALPSNSPEVWRHRLRFNRVAARSISAETPPVRLHLLSSAKANYLLCTNPGYRQNGSG